MVTTEQKNSAALIISITIGLAIGYAILRYHIVGSVPWKDFPFYILNKGISLSAFVLFTPAVYGNFFEADNTLTLFGGLSMLEGVLAFVVLWAYNMTFQTHLREDKAFVEFITSRRFLLFALLLGAFHLIFMGYQGWLDPDGWHGGLPPISLVAFVIFAAGYVINLFGRE